MTARSAHGARAFFARERCIAWRRAPYRTAERLARRLRRCNIGLQHTAAPPRPEPRRELEMAPAAVSRRPSFPNPAGALALNGCELWSVVRARPQAPYTLSSRHAYWQPTCCTKQRISSHNHNKRVCTTVL
eukprot:362817-Chlamydomonas_euryale.AAC.4